MHLSMPAARFINVFFVPDSSCGLKLLSGTTRGIGSHAINHQKIRKFIVCRIPGLPVVEGEIYVNLLQKQVCQVMVNAPVLEVLL